MNLNETTNSEIQNLLNDLEQKLKKYQEDSKKDLEIKRDQLDHESLITPTIANRWQIALATEKKILGKFWQKQKKVKRQRWEYYRGYAKAETYKKEPQDKKIQKSDIDIYLESDAQYQAIMEIIQNQQLIVDFLQFMLEQINQRNWNIRNALEFMKFINGG